MVPIKILILHFAGLILGILLDLIIGDPHFMPHPVRFIGQLIRFLEGKLLDPLAEKGERNRKRESGNGILAWFIVMLSVMTACLIIVITAYAVHGYLGAFAEAVLTFFILAAGSLYRESMAVYRELGKHDIKAARYALSMIVGRDTDELCEEDIIKAAVETVAENTSDGVIAPLIYTVLGGPVLGMMYKAVNTMDSMLGYKNKRYGYFGSFAARADDLFNLVPSRISALAMIAGSTVLSLFSKDYNGKNAYRIWIRDRKNHSSPNSAQTESVCAGALGLRLGGTHLYEGIPVEKPYIGDETRTPEAADIKRANSLMFMTEAVVSVLLISVSAALILRGSG